MPIIDISSQGTGGLGGGTTNCFPNATPASFTISITGKILFNGKTIKTADCCTSALLTPLLGTGTYSFVDGVCYRDYSPSSQVCPEGRGITCIDSGTFGSWDNTYTVEKGQSLSVINPTLFSTLQNLVNNSGSFATFVDTGDFIDQACCSSLNYTFSNNICQCEISVVNEPKNPFCFSTLDDFIDIAENNFPFFNNNFTNIGPSLGLSSSDTTFIIQNLLSTNTTNRTNARTLLSNALASGGGVYLNVGLTTGNLTTLTSAECNRISGAFWDGTNCKCQQTSTEPPTSNVCNLTDVKVINTYQGSTPIQIVVPKDYSSPTNTTLLTEQCCLKLKNENNLPWYWESPYCYANVTANCLPTIITLNETPIELQPCESDIEIYMWVYFKTPENSVNLPPPTPPDEDIPDDTVIVEGPDDEVVIIDENGDPIIDEPPFEPPIGPPTGDPPIEPPIPPPDVPTTPTGTPTDTPTGTDTPTDIPGDIDDIIFGEQPRPSRSENCEI